jgi:hypothetical protein
MDTQNFYEKKMNIVMIPHLLLWRCLDASPDVIEFVLFSIKPFIQMACTYLIEFTAQKNLPSSSIFYT